MDRYNVENSYLDEKEDALNSLRILAEECGPAFLPHLEKCFDEAYKLLIHPQDDIRKAAVDALAQFCVALSRPADAAEGESAQVKARSSKVTNEKSHLGRVTHVYGQYFSRGIQFV